MKYELRPMDVGEILDRSLKVYLSNFGLLISIGLVVAIPMTLAMVGLLVALGVLFLKRGAAKRAHSA